MSLRVRIERNWTRVSIVRAKIFPGCGDGLLNDEQETLVMELFEGEAISC